MLLQLKRTVSKGLLFLQCLGDRLCARHMICPSCGTAGGQVIDRRFLLLSLVRCPHCQLLSRRPSDPAERNAHFYQFLYHEPANTVVPSDAEIEQLKQANFRTFDNFDAWLHLFNQLDVPRGGVVVDFGCNWGYGAWQFRQAGYRVQAVELSRPRAAFAREKLGLTVYANLDELPAGDEVDVFFSSHVLEHVPNLQALLEQARQRLKPGGLFLALTPNGSEAFRQVDKIWWHMLWGRKHCNYLDDVYWRQQFASWPLLLLSRSIKDYRLRLPADVSVSAALLDERPVYDMSGHELLVLARKPG